MLSTHDIEHATAVIWDPAQEANLCLVETRFGAIELVEGRPVANILKRGPGSYHVCYEVDNLDGTVQRLQGSGCRPVTAPVEAILFGGRRVAFMLGPTGLIELLEAE